MKTPIQTIPIQATIHQIYAFCLDPIRLILQDCGTEQGRIIIECYGRAWGCYWGAMGDPLRVFLAKADTEYLVSRLARVKETKREREYLAKIVTAIKEALPSL